MGAYKRAENDASIRPERVHADNPDRCHDDRKKRRNQRVDLTFVAKTNAALTLQQLAVTVLTESRTSSTCNTAGCILPRSLPAGEGGPVSALASC